MDIKFSRRRFLAAAAASATATAVLPACHANLATGADEPPLFKISLAQWSLHRALQSGKIDNLDFPKVSKQEFGIEGVEFVNQFFKDKATDNKYLAELKKRCVDNGVEPVLIMIDGEGALGDADRAKRMLAVEKHYKWVSAARFLGCHSIRVNAQSSGSFQDQAQRAADGLRMLAEFAQKVGVNVLVENHGGLSSNGQWLAQVIRKVGMDNCGTLPDFGNFRIRTDRETKEEIWYDRYLGMASLMPFAKAVSAKSHDFDDQGNETRTDYMKVLQIVIDAGYRGWVGVEYEGGKLGEYEGVRATKKLLEKCRGQLSA